MADDKTKKVKYMPNLYSLINPQRDAVWLAPVRTKPRRTYDGTKKAFSSEGDHTPYLGIHLELTKGSRAVCFDIVAIDKEENQ